MEDRLTERQREALRLVIETVERTGSPPTITELSRAMGHPNAMQSNVHLIALERKGYLRRVPNAARGIRVLRNPDGTSVDRSDEAA